MEDIAARARITKPVLYDHYSSKHALFREALESIRDRLIGKGKSIVEAGGDPEHQFRLAVDAFLKFVEQEPDAARVLLRVPSGDATAAQLSREVQAGASAGIATLLTAFMPDSPQWQVRAASEFLKEGLHAVARWWLENRGPGRAELVELMTQIVWPGLQAQARARGPHVKERAQ
jgi:AcrR family transcriptional regulator